MTDSQLAVQGTVAQYWQQKLVANPQCVAVPLLAQDVISASAYHRLSSEDFYSLWFAD